MRKLVLFAALLCAVPLASCDTVPSGPIAIAQQSTLDEKGAVAAHLSYKGWVKLVELGVNVGQIKGERARQLAALDNQLYSTLQAVDAAYAASNARAYDIALKQFNNVLKSAHAAYGVN